MRRFWTWLGTNNNAHRVQTSVAVLQAIVVTIGLGFAAVTLHYNGKTLDYNAKHWTKATGSLGGPFSTTNRLSWVVMFLITKRFIAFTGTSCHRSTG